jgi:aerobic carbon-monoxide dehydrogenase large subunit
MAISKLVGARIHRREDPRLITGRGRYVDDLAIPGLLHMAIVRSPHAHARINQIEVGEAQGLPGVVASLTRADFEKVIHTNLMVTGTGAHST